MKKRLLSILLTACMLVGLLPTAALAADGDVDYLYCDENGANWQTGTKAASEYTVVTSGDTTWGTSGTTTWYVVNTDVTIGTEESPSRVTVTGNVHLILKDGCTLTVNGGIQVQDNSDAESSKPNTNALTIYAQTQPVLDADGNVTNNVGQLVTQNVAGNDAGIGGSGIGNGGTITINGGIVTATSGSGAGIGGGGSVSGGDGGSGGNITINGGVVKAIGGDGAAIGGGNGVNSGSGGTITINGGTVTAIGGDGAAIGGGCSRNGTVGDGGTITINGGTVTATSGSGAGIGGGSKLKGTAGGAGGIITINGGTVTATSGSGAGIGGGTGDKHGAAGGTITITGGIVEATSTNGGAGIGGSFGDVRGGDGGTVTISGGTVTATGTKSTGIGGGGSVSGGSGSGGTFQTQEENAANGNAVLFASSIGDQTNQSTWHGIIFEGSSGAVYGNQTLTADLTIPSGKTLTVPSGTNLTIPSGKTLTIAEGGTLTNNGTIYVDGTLSGTVSGNGPVYYHLALTSCTATGNPSLETHDAKTYATENSEITLTPVTPTGYQFKSWTVSGADVTVENNKFTMPAGAVTVAAEFVYTPPVIPTYPPIILDTENGTVTVSPKYPTAGSRVTITATPDEGYEVDEVTVTDRSGKPVEFTDNGDGTFSFKQPSGKVTITVTFKKTETEPEKDPVKDCLKDGTCPAAKFTDVKMDWTHDGIHYCVANGLMNGVGSDRFDPDGTSARAMLVTVLYRLEGEPAVGECTFSDVLDGEWYTNAVIWAAENKIVEGYDGKFDPTGDITREQFATILYRYAVYKGYDVTASADLTAFADADTISDWAETAMSWAVGAGLFEGKGENNLDPTGKATRAEMAAILYRFCENVAE